MDLVFLGRQREKLAQHAVLIEAIRGVKGEEVAKSFRAYVSEVYPLLDLEKQEREKMKAVKEELDRLSKSTFVFRIPASVQAQALQGPGSPILEALEKNRALRQGVRRDTGVNPASPSPTRQAPTVGRLPPVSGRGGG